MSGRALHSDDEPTGRLLSRREIIAALGLAGAAWLGRGAHAAPASTACVVRPAQTEGPYFVDEMLNRSDLRRDPVDGSLQPGAPLEFTIGVSRWAAGGCLPLAGAQVDVWHCDHRGVYSGVRDRAFDTVGQAFLRGYQRTDAAGRASFTTVYPGWYPGRTVHIHFKIRSPAARQPGFKFTSQLYFDDALTDRVFAAEPYSARGPRNVRNADDRIFRSGGADLLLALEPRNDGHAGTFEVALEGV
jgi:protocatechuate 3,4-dioxygenase beta subunit